MNRKIALDPDYCECCAYHDADFPTWKGNTSRHLRCENCGHGRDWRIDNYGIVGAVKAFQDNGKTALEKAYQDYIDGFSSLEGWVMDNPQLRQVINGYLKGILEQTDYKDDVIINGSVRNVRRKTNY